MEWERTGVLECWSVGVTEDWSVGVLEYCDAQSGVPDFYCCSITSARHFTVLRRTAGYFPHDHRSPSLPGRRTVLLGRLRAGAGQTRGQTELSNEPRRTGALPSP